MITVEPQVQALIFDFDGTLVDTMPFHYLAWQETVKSLGGDFPEKLFHDTAGMPSDQIVVILNETFGYQLDPQETTLAKEHRFLTHYLPKVQPIEPIVAIAKQYQGKLPMAVASGGISIVIKNALDITGLANLFDTVVTSEDVVRGKPAPDTFLEAARRLDVEPKYCQVFEDSEAGLEAARRAEMIATDVRPWRNEKKQKFNDRKWFRD
jgi:HAD superfamily hydrolase (TIGR01509 family)